MNERIEKLVEAAIAKTQNGRLDWQALDEEAFRATIGGGELHVRREWTPLPDGDTQTVSTDRYSIRVLDGFGRVVSEARGLGGDPEVEPAAKLFAAARGAALHERVVIDNMLRELAR